VTEVIGWPLAGGIGLLLLLTGQPLGRPTPSLAKRLAALGADPHQASPPSSFASPTLERLLVPHSRPPGGCCSMPLRPLASRPAGSCGG
jgi:hypothetical protein